jgi:hypothetical protein
MPGPGDQTDRNTSWLHRVAAPGFKHIDGQKAERAFRVIIAKEGAKHPDRLLKSAPFDK